MLRYQRIPSGVSGTADYSIKAFRVAKAYVLPTVEQQITRASEYSASRVLELQTLSCSFFSVEDEAPCNYHEGVSFGRGVPYIYIYMKERPL